MLTSFDAIRVDQNYGRKSPSHAPAHNKQYLHINERHKVRLAARKPPACLLHLARAFPANAINHHLQTAALIKFQRKSISFQH
jgi:hypothetical protein